METITGNQVRMARAALRMDVRALAALAGFDKMTVVRVEAGESVRASTFERLREALETEGVVFLPAVEGVREEGVAFKWGFDFSKLGQCQSAGSDTTGGHGLDAHAWDEDFSEAAPAATHDPDFPPLEITDEMRDELREYLKTADVSPGGRAVLTRDFRL